MIPSMARRKKSPDLKQIRLWREEQFEARKPSGLLDYYAAHGLCWRCRGKGMRQYAGTNGKYPPGWEVRCESCNASGKITAAVTEALPPPTTRRMRKPKNLTSRCAPAPVQPEPDLTDELAKDLGWD